MGDPERTPLKNDLDPDGMDNESSNDELEAGGDPAEFDDDDDGVEADGVRETPEPPR